MTSPAAGTRPAAPQTPFSGAYDLHRQGRTAEAELAYRAILDAVPHHFDAAHFLAMILLARGDAAEAEQLIAGALEHRPAGIKPQNLAQAHNSHAVALITLRRFEDALAALDAGLALAPGMGGIIANRAWVLYELGRLDEAIDLCGKVIAAKRDFAPAHKTLAKALIAAGRPAEAIVSFGDAIALMPDDHDCFHGRAFPNLLLGNFAKGWEDMEHRRFLKSHAGLHHAAHADPSLPRDALRDKRVLVTAEQGIGDEIMLAGMIPDLMADAGSVTLECDARLESLFARSIPGIKTVARRSPPEWNAADHDIVIPSLRLGRYYRASRADFPERLSYLAPDPGIAAAWKARLGGLDGLKVGISWSGGTEATRRGLRSVPLEQWTPLFALDGVRFVSLQYGEAARDIARINSTLTRSVTAFAPAEIDNFDQLAGLVASLDLVVTVQTALVHLSGALGKTAKVMVPHAPEWRYGASDSRMPWYASVELYRQEKPGAWDDVLARVAADIRNGTPHVR